MSDNAVLVRFGEAHMKELEDMFRLTDEQRIGLDVAGDLVADMLSTFNWAMHEGDAAICYVGFPEANQVIGWIRNYCTERCIDFEIRLEAGYHKLFFP
ncbi:hypothetical protein ABES02_29800 [Neobacillus pocheonensis]|uniref:hypothetical protein n=1 Tax=Neobacillus pocheonensis TaxID=363869 RepID=UPI003D26DBE5